MSLPGLLLRLEGGALLAVSLFLYNVFHTLPLPAALAVIGIVADSALAVAMALIWLAHIGMDRLLGSGPKYPMPFRDTHLGRV